MIRLRFACLALVLLAKATATEPPARADAGAAATAVNWLPSNEPAKPETNPLLAPVNHFLASLNGRVRLLACRYEGSRLVDAAAIGNGALVAHQATWTAHLTATSEADIMDLKVRFAVTEGRATSAGVAVALDFRKWDTANFVFARPCSTTATNSGSCR